VAFRRRVNGGGIENLLGEVVRLHTIENSMRISGDIGRSITGLRGNGNINAALEGFGYSHGLHGWPRVSRQK